MNGRAVQVDKEISDKQFAAICRVLGESREANKNPRFRAAAKEVFEDLL